MIASKSFYLFVYGSLRSGFHSEAYKYISQYFDLAGNAKVKGQLYDLGEYPAAIPASGESYIIGELYKIKKEQELSWAIGQLDDYEGLTVEQGEIPLYRRELADAFINDQVIPAWVYWYNGDINGKPLVPSGDILEYLKKKLS